MLLGEAACVGQNSPGESGVKMGLNEVPITLDCGTVILVRG